MCIQTLHPNLTAGAPLAGKWALEILYCLRASPARWHMLTSSLPGAAPNALTRQLKALEQAGLLCRTVYSSKPPKIVEYRLSALGRGYLPFLAALERWGQVYGTEPRFDAPGIGRRVLASRWMPAILGATVTPRRFGAIQEELGLSRGVLAQQLEALRQMGLVLRRDYACFPPRVEYESSPRARALMAAFALLPT